MAAWPRPITSGHTVPGGCHGSHHSPRGQCPHYRLVGCHSLSRKVVHQQILSGRVLYQRILSWRSQRFIGGWGSYMCAKQWPALRRRGIGSACKCRCWSLGYSGSEDNLRRRLARHHRRHDLKTHMVRNENVGAKSHLVHYPAFVGAGQRLGAGG